MSRWDEWMQEFESEHEREGDRALADAIVDRYLENSCDTEEGRQKRFEKSSEYAQELYSFGWAGVRALLEREAAGVGLLAYRLAVVVHSREERRDPDARAMVRALLPLCVSLMSDMLVDVFLPEYDEQMIKRQASFIIDVYVRSQRRQGFFLFHHIEFGAQLMRQIGHAGSDARLERLLGLLMRLVATHDDEAWAEFLSHTQSARVLGKMSDAWWGDIPRELLAKGLAVGRSEVKAILFGRLRLSRGEGTVVGRR